MGLSYVTAHRLGSPRAAKYASERARLVTGWRLIRQGPRLLPPTAAESVYRDAPPSEPEPGQPGRAGDEG